jgi:hypothetical protein
MTITNAANTGTNSIDQETNSLDNAFRYNMDSPDLDIARAHEFALLSGNVSYKATCAAGMLKLTVSCCKDIVRIVGT